MSSGVLRKLAGLLVLALVITYPLIPGLNDKIESMLGKKIGDSFPTIFIYGILALALNVVVGYTGLLHLGIAAFFGIGAFTTGILTVGQYPFQFGFLPVLVVSTMAAALLGGILCVPTLRLRGDYLALVTLGFGLITVTALRNLQEITGGMQTLNPIPPPKIPEILRCPLESLGLTMSWTEDYRLFYYLTLGYLLLVFVFLRNLEHSRLGRAWVALREDELAATCMGLNAARLKLLAFTLAAGLAGMAGSLYATKMTNTTEPTRFDFQLSCTILSCLILGGLGNRTGVLLGVFLVAGYDFLFAPAADAWLQRNDMNPNDKGYLKFSMWNLMIFGLALVLMMRFRSSGLLPKRRGTTTGKGA
ncbi:branched-chain amino acid ABC transporter permease [Zavarzinella formosa]|uniref:branched-chain amino acid ABC transporter permease n=1 Tax=Zavarzinella formosa TaxID=360055 RepID=UPI0002D95C74|nr:branched-chain amino acid ABC transporter permease [Zavarzinella formosa]